MRNRKLTAVFLGTVFALGLIAGGYGAFGETVNAKAKKTEKGEYKEVQIGFPSAGSDWAEGTLALAQEKGYLDEYLHPLGYDAKLTAFTGAAPAILGTGIPGSGLCLLCRLCRSHGEIQWH